MPHREPREQPPAHFPEAVAQWRLAMRTEVKRTSSLPSSMFDACDPMLEMRLAETTEAMLGCLQDGAGAVYHEPRGGGDRHVETVDAHELRALPPQLASDGDVVDLDAGLTGEAVVVLADTCCSGDAAAAASAVNVLRTQCGIDATAGPASAAAVLMPLLQQAIDGSGPAAERLAEVCERIAAMVTRAAARADDSSGGGPR
jgi:hypothetical protein